MNKKSLLSLLKDYQFRYDKIMLMNICIPLAVYKYLHLPGSNVCNRVSVDILYLFLIQYLMLFVPIAIGIIYPVICISFKMRQ
jgi:hypothetical protein